MSAESLAQQNRRLREQPLWMLLASDNGPAVLAILETHLLDRDRTLPSSVLVERVKEDLKRLRHAGFDIAQSADRILSQWLNAGYLMRRLPTGAAEEEFELSLEAVNAIRFLRNLRKPRAAATESRLSLVISQLMELEQSTQDSAQARLETLIVERDRIDRQIEAVESGQWRPLTNDRALERAREVLALADDLVADFRRVRDEFERLHRRLREQIMESDQGRGEVLQSLFDGVDLVADSDAGRSFAAFYGLLVDQEKSSSLDGAVDEVLRRTFADDLNVRERKQLRGLTHTLLGQAMSVHEVMQGFGRSLREFVRSTEFRELKRLNELIREAERNALLLKEILKPHSKVGRALDLSSAEIGSIDEHRLYDPAASFQGGEMQQAIQDVSLEDMADLFAHGEIDFAALRMDVEAVLVQQVHASVGEVLALRPARQGLGSVVGLLWMAEQGGVIGNGQERIEWVGLDGVRREGLIPAAYFRREEEDAG